MGHGAEQQSKIDARSCWNENFYSNEKLDSLQIDTMDSARYSRATIWSAPSSRSFHFQAGRKLLGNSLVRRCTQLNCRFVDRRTTLRVVISRLDGWR